MARVRRKFSEEFKQEAVRLVTVRGVSMAQAARDLEVHVNLLQLWIRKATGDAAAASWGFARGCWPATEGFTATPEQSE